MMAANSSSSNPGVYVTISGVGDAVATRCHDNTLANVAPPNDPVEFSLNFGTGASYRLFDDVLVIFRLGPIDLN